MSEQQPRDDVNDTIDADIPWADDAIPADAISLTDAFHSVAGLVFNHRPLIQEFDEYWSEVLRKSREFENDIQVDKEIYTKELEEECFRGMEANLFLRLEIEAGKLRAYVRDSETGEILKLRSDGWVSSEWDDYIPFGIWNDYISDDYDDPGPSEQTLIRGHLRPVFFFVRRV
jgi:hypothetical protein